MPYDSSFFIFSGDPFQDLINGCKLLVATDLFDSPGPFLFKDNEVLDDIEQILLSNNSGANSYTRIDK